MPAPASNPPGLILVAHGSPDPDWRRPLEQLHARLSAQLGDHVYLAYLVQAPSVETCVRELSQRGYRRVHVMAALLSPGGRHVKLDIPEAVGTAEGAHPEVRIELVPGSLGDDAGVIEALAAAAIARLPRSRR